MKMLKLLLMTMAIAVTSAFISDQQQKKQAKPWVVPQEYKVMKNPIAKDIECVNAGKVLYSKHCRSCHGNTGKGDGPKARRLKTGCGDFTSATFHKQSDGELYYKSIIGRDEMPNYEKKIPKKEDRWALVNYVRSLKKK